jgi:hypothetical protein
MTLKTPWYECDSRFIAAHYQPAALIDLAISRDIDTHRLLRGTGLFYDDILAGQVRISPQQFLVLIDNAQRLLDADDSSFLFGQRLLPGHYGAASQALQQAGNLQQALELLIEMRALFSPLLAPRLLLDEQHAYLYWVDGSGAGPHWRFLIESCMTAVVAMARWLSGQQLPWCFHFAHPQPRYVEQYWVHLGEDLHFDSQLDMLRLPREFMTAAWPNAAHTADPAASFPACPARCAAPRARRVARRSGPCASPRHSGRRAACRWSPDRRRRAAFRSARRPPSPCGGRPVWGS